MWFRRHIPPVSYSENFTLSDRVLPLKVSANPRAKRMTLRIESGGKGLRVTVPPGTAAPAVEGFLERYRGWMETKLARLPAPATDGAMLKAGVKIPLLGRPHLIVHKTGRGTTTVAPANDGELQIIVYGDAAHLPRRIRDFLRKQAESVITPFITRHSDIAGRKPKSVRFRDTTSRWGSCSADGNLSFSWRIVMAPPGVVNYLVAHEVAHLIEMNHGPQFWALCEKLCPDTKRCRDWLKRNGQTLHAIDFG